MQINVRNTTGAPGEILWWFTLKISSSTANTAFLVRTVVGI